MHCFRSPKGSQQIQTPNMAHPWGGWHEGAERCGSTTSAKSAGAAVGGGAVDISFAVQTTDLTSVLCAKFGLVLTQFKHSLKTFSTGTPEARLVCLLLFFDILHHWKRPLVMGKRQQNGQLRSYWGFESASDVQWWRRQEEKEEERRIWATEGFWITLPETNIASEISVHHVDLGWSGWWQLKYFLMFTPYLGKIPILANIFQRGWNRQLGRFD